MNKKLPLFEQYVNESTDFDELVAYEPAGNHDSDSDFLAKADAFIRNEENDITERAAVVKAYDRALGEETEDGTDEEVVAKYLADASN